MSQFLELKNLVLRQSSEIADLKSQAVVNSGWVQTTIGGFNDQGERTVAEFCLEGPAVVEVSAMISVIPADTDTKLTLFVDLGGEAGMQEKTFQRVRDEDKDDMIGIYWMGEIPSDAQITVFLNGKI